MPVNKYKPTSPGIRFQTHRIVRRDHEDDAGEAADQGQAEDRRPQQPRAGSPPGAAAAATSGSTATSTSSATSTASRRRSRRSSTTRTARRASRCCTTPTARSATSCAGRPEGRRRRSSPATDADILPGNALPLKNIPLGTQIHNVELKAGKGGQMARSAGVGAQLDGERRRLRARCGCRRARCARSTSSATRRSARSATSSTRTCRSARPAAAAGSGKRPHVRGVAMNPVDHPLGGGEGKTSGGRHPVTPWGQPTKGYKTRNNKRTNKFIVKRRTK